jgi:hypothetical protein
MYLSRIPEHTLSQSTQNGALQSSCHNSGARHNSRLTKKSVAPDLPGWRERHKPRFPVAETSIGASRVSSKESMGSGKLGSSARIARSWKQQGYLLRILLLARISAPWHYHCAFAIPLRVGRIIRSGGEPLVPARTDSHKNRCFSRGSSANATTSRIATVDAHCQPGSAMQRARWSDQ